MTAFTWTGLRRRGSLDRSPGGRPRRWAGRLACTAAGVLAALGLAAPAAIADQGGLVYAGCIGDHVGCTQTSPTGALDYPSGLAVTPDGRQLYAAHGGISHFWIDPAGNLILAGFYPALAGYVNGLAVTPDGAHLYLASRDASSVSHFRIDPAGNLTFAGCIGAYAGCTATSPPCALLGAGALAVTPDGAHLYVGASSPSWRTCPGSAVSHLRIDPAGNLYFAGCIGSLPGCTHVDAVAAQSVATTPLGADVYSAGFSTVSHFRVDQYGNLIFVGCIGDYPGCTPITPGVLDYTVAVAVTNDGSQLYAAASSGSAVSHFTIAGFFTAAGP